MIFPKRILLIKLRYIGDVVLSTPLLRILAKRVPSASVSFLVNRGTEGVLQGNPYLHETLLVSRGSWKSQVGFIAALRRAHFDAVLDLTDGDRSAFLSLMTGAPLRVGYNRENRIRGKCYTHVVTSDYGSMHMVDYHAQVLSFLGISDSIGQPEIFLSPMEEEQGRQWVQCLTPSGTRLVLLHPSARYPFKAWPPERFAALADRLAQEGNTVALIGNHREDLLGRRICELCHSVPHNLMGKTSLPQLAGLMKFSALLIGNDGGPMHMAGAVGCSVLGLFGPTDPAVWGPRGEGGSVIYKSLDCRECFYPGCHRGENSCMKMITVEEVFDKALDILSAQKTQQELTASRIYGKAGSGA